MIEGRHSRTTGTSRSANDLTGVSPSLQPILSRNVSDISHDINHCVIIINIRTRNREPQSIITKFNTIKVDWHLFTSNEVWKPATSPNLLHSTKTLTDNIYRTIKCAAEFSISMIEINKYFHEP